MEDQPTSISTKQSRDQIYPEPAGSMFNGTMPNRIPIELNRRAGSVVQKLPFEIFIRGEDLVATSGLVGSTNVAEVVKAAPANGTWYFQAKVIINSTTGVVTSSTAEWASAEGTDTSTTFYYTIGSADVVSGSIDPLSLTNFTYGPIVVLLFGGVSNKWTVQLF